MCDQGLWPKRRISFQISLQMKPNSYYLYGPRDHEQYIPEVYCLCYNVYTTNSLHEMIKQLPVWSVCKFTQFYRIIILFNIDICIPMVYLFTNCTKGCIICGCIYGSNNNRNNWENWVAWEHPNEIHNNFHRNIYLPCNFHFFPVLQLVPLGCVILEWFPFSIRFVLTDVDHILLHIDGLASDCSYSIANALGLLQFCNKPQGYKPTLQI